MVYIMLKTRKFGDCPMKMAYFMHCRKGLNIVLTMPVVQLFCAEMYLVYSTAVPVTGHSKQHSSSPGLFVRCTIHSPT
jgi:hypothetical protein